MKGRLETIRILRARDYVATPWKNGGGVTREIAVRPAGAGLDAFDWRVSMATVAVGGPFSVFAGVDRSLAVLEGRLILTIDGCGTATLDAESQPIAFPGDVWVDAGTPDAPVTDLNVMTRRGWARADVARLRLIEGDDLQIDTPTLIVACGLTRLAYAGDDHLLERFDAALLDPAPGAGLLTCGPGAHLVIARIRPW